MTETITRQYYDETYYAGHLSRLWRHDRFTRVKIKRLLSLAKPRKNDLVLDLGSGVGTVMIALARTGVKVFGLDYSFKSLVLAKTNYLREVAHAEFGGMCCDGRCVGMKSDSLDAVVAVDFTEHLDKSMLGPTLAEIYRILKPGGSFVVYTPNRGHLFERLKKYNVILKEDKSHIGLRTMKEYQELLSKAGFSIVEAYFRPTDIPFFNMLETVAMHIPIVGDLARRRICIRGEKTNVRTIS